MAANYDNAAWFYDRLAALVFGDSLNRAQRSLLHYVPANAKILIAGGGTGKILEQLALVHPSGLQITYVEISENMTAIARKRAAGDNQVEFIIAPVEEVNLARDYDVIITPFLLDNFDGATLRHLFDHLNNALGSGSIWINTDFQLTGKWWQSVLLKTMIVFFKILCGVETNGLPDTGSLFKAAGYKVIEEQAFYGEFVGSRVYRRNSTLLN